MGNTNRSLETRINFNKYHLRIIASLFIIYERLYNFMYGQFHSSMQPIQGRRGTLKGEGQSPPRCEMGLINLRLIVSDARRRRRWRRDSQERINLCRRIMQPSQVNASAFQDFS